VPPKVSGKERQIMKDENPKVEQKTHEQTRPAREARERENLDEAFDRIYKRYGTDLTGFFRDAYREALEKRCDPSDDLETCLR
jgi:hypothetical protein